MPEVRRNQNFVPSYIIYIQYFMSFAAPFFFRRFDEKKNLMPIPRSTRHIAVLHLREEVPVFVDEEFNYLDVRRRRRAWWAVTRFRCRYITAKIIYKGDIQS